METTPPTRRKPIHGDSAAPSLARRVVELVPITLFWLIRQTRFYFE